MLVWVWAWVWVCEGVPIGHRSEALCTTSSDNRGTYREPHVVKTAGEGGSEVRELRLLAWKITTKQPKQQRQGSGSDNTRGHSPSRTTAAGKSPEALVRYKGHTLHLPHTAAYADDRNS